MGLDIIVYAIVAGVIISRLWSVLGRRDGDERQRPNPFVAPVAPPSDGAPPPDNGGILLLPDRKPKDSEEKPPVLTASGLAMDSLAGRLDQVKKLDAAFNEKQFLQGAKTAFGGIVTAFAAGDLSAVGRVLSPAMREHFQQAIAARAAAEQTLETRIDSITEAEVTAAKIEETNVVLTVHFASKQVNVVRDKSGNIVSGNPTRAEDAEDLWTFARDTKSPDPNWLLVETRSR